MIRRKLKDLVWCIWGIICLKNAFQFECKEIQMWWIDMKSKLIQIWNWYKIYANMQMDTVLYIIQSKTSLRFLNMKNNCRIIELFNQVNQSNAVIQTVFLSYIAILIISSHWSTLFLLSQIPIPVPIRNEIRLVITRV